MPTDLNIFFF